MNVIVNGFDSLNASSSKSCSGTVSSIWARFLASTLTNLIVKSLSKSVWFSNRFSRSTLSFLPPAFQSTHPGSTAPLADRSTRRGAAATRDAVDNTRERTSSLPRIVVLLQLRYIIGVLSFVILVAPGSGPGHRRNIGRIDGRLHRRWSRG